MTDERKVGDSEYVLTTARALISKPENWIKAAYEKGAAFCASGAMAKAGQSLYYFNAYELLRKEMGGGILRFNDSHTHEEVLAAFDRAIAKAHEKGV